MFEKVNPSHPDKVADRIAGAIVDLAYAEQNNPKIAVEVLIGHGICHIIAETSVSLSETQIQAIVERISGIKTIDYQEVGQDVFLAHNQADGFKCGDNGIFKGTPITAEQQNLADLANAIYKKYGTDGKYVADGDRRLIICQSNAQKSELKKAFPAADVNPLGYWTGGTEVDTGATNRKLGSDMGDSITGGGLHGKDLSKADVSANIYAFLLAQKEGKPIELNCAIGDECINGKPYAEIVEVAREYVQSIGGFEKLAEWGLIRPSEVNANV